jgi:YbgC/YbaW family acyl-CoA thioester hydrolase
MSTAYSVQIRESHLDTFGHVNNATYLTLYEEARWDLITRNGYGLRDVQTKGKGPVILEVNLKFLKELKLREQIQITVEMIDYQKKIAHMKQQMIKADGTIASEAIFTFGFFDLVARKLIEPTPEWMKAIGMKV